MAEAPRPVDEIAAEGGALPIDALMATQRPVLVRGFVRDWPLVRAGLAGDDAAIAYLKRFEGTRPITVYRGDAAMRGRFFYDEAVTGFNFEAGRAPLGDVLDRIAGTIGAAGAPHYYVGSTDLDIFLPGLRGENDLGAAVPAFANDAPTVSIWIGNRTTATAHYDMSNNIACCVAGRRRFTLFPPGQVANLYPGPLEPTPGGQVVSMVDFAAPDFERFPGFREALATAQVAEMEPGDLLFYPALWWHHVEALAPFNILINYWWNGAPAFMDMPQTALLHAMLSLRDRPEPEKAAWRALFDYYVFGPGDRAGAHLPEHARGPLGRLDEMQARRLRGQLLNKLNR